MFKDTKAFSSFAVDDLKKDEKGIFRGAERGPHAGSPRGVQAGGNGPNIAWFKDPAGNILSVLEEK